MIKNLNEDTALKFKSLSAEEKAKRGILGRLYGPVASFKVPTRNERLYSQALWEKLFKSPLIVERFKNGGIFGELNHPQDRSETDMEKIAIVMPEPPCKDDKGQLVAYVDIIDTPCGRIAYQLAKYGYKFGISSRGEGDLITDYSGNESVDPDTYTLSAFDLVEIPAVENARLCFTESLNTKKSLQESLKETLDAASEADRKIMEETLDNLNIKLNEANEYTILLALKDEDTGVVKRDKDVRHRGKAVQYMLDHPTENLSLYYERYLNGRFLDSKLLVCRAADSNIDSYYKQDIKKVQIYIDGELVPKKTDPAEIKKARDDGKLVLVNFGSKLKESLAEDVSSERMDDYQWLINVEGLTPEEAWEQITTYDYANDEEFTENMVTEEKSLDIDNLEDKVETMAVDNNEALVEALQDALKANAELEQKVMTLQEKLSVCYAKETKIEEEAEKYKTSVRQLAESSKEAKALQVKVSLLEEKLTDTKKVNNNLKEQLDKIKVKVEKDASKTSSLRESISNKTNEVFKLNETISTLNESLKAADKKYEEVNKKLTESIEKRNALAAECARVKELVNSTEKDKAALTESVAQLKKDISLQKSNAEQKLAKSKQLIEKYKKATTIAVDKYIQSQAVRLGSSVEEIKNRLPESYSFNDIDKVCEDLQNYNLNMSKLPFNTLAKKVNTNEGLKVKGVSSKNESILPVNRFDDDIDADLIYLAGQ